MEMVTFDRLADGKEHVACVFGPLPETPLVRIHSECLTGDVFGSARCDCGPQLQEALRLAADEGGVLLYLRQEGRGIGLYNKIDAYVLQDKGLDTFEANLSLGRGADERQYDIAAQMLYALNLSAVRLLTNNPLKVAALRAHGVKVRRVLPTGYFRSDTNESYLDTKARLAGHTFVKAPEGCQEPPT
ncbi:GTP cyclohydrolase II [Streptomyces griseoviridis]|uniref:GTP cyclohydrolase II n=1 Tax=Streptomyces griseoviridis TaxID=45398 RepID=UPI0033ECE86F